MMVEEERVVGVPRQGQQHSSAFIGSGRKLRAIRKCIGNLNDDIDVIIRQGLCLVDEITECVSLSISLESGSKAGVPKKKWSSVREQGTTTEARGRSGVEGFPAIERGLKARERLEFRSKKASFEFEAENRQRQKQKHKEAGRERAPLADLSNFVSPNREERLEIVMQKHENRARDEAARVIQKHYKSHFRKRLQSTLLIQACFRTYLCCDRIQVLKAERYWQSVQRKNATLLLNYWRKRSFSRNRLRQTTAQREEKYGSRSHYHLGKKFDGELIKPEEGVFVMAKEYQAWRMKALAYLKWSKFVATS